MSSNKGKYFEVGETFKEGDVELKVAKPTCICVGCYYNNEKCATAPACILQHRKDNQDVIFISNE